MRQTVHVSLVKTRAASCVVVQYEGTTIEQTFEVPREATMAEALAIAAVDMRMNGLPNGVQETRYTYGDHGYKYVYER